MSNHTIDNEVVELEFDNSKFEKNVQESMSTLDKLKAKLRFDGATKGLDEIEKASSKINFNGLTSGVDGLSLRFDALSVVASTALNNITNKLVDFGIQLTKSATIDQVAAGWSKMDLMTGSVQTLVNSTGKSVEEINGYLDKLMWYSDETSFGFTDMTSALATMTSSGGDIEKLIPMIEGIANATAYAGKGAAEFSRVIYNLNQSYSAGFLNYADWKSVQLAGVNSKALMETLIRSGEELGKIQKGQVTVGNFTETLKKKWADTEVMEDAFNKFAVMTEEAYKLVEAGEFDTASEAYDHLSGQFDEIAERAAKSAQEAKTFKEAIDSVKDAVSSKWLNIFSTIFGDYNQQKETWTNLANDLWDIFASPLDNLNTTIGHAFNSKWDNFTEGLQEAGYDVTNLDDEFIKFVKDYGAFNPRVSQEEWSKTIDNYLNEYGSISKLMSSGIFDSTKYVQKFFESIDKQSGTVSNLGSSLEQVQAIYDDIWMGKYGYKDSKDRIDKLTEAGIDYATAQGLIYKMLDEGHKGGYKLVAEDIAYLSKEELISLGITLEDAEAIKTLSEAAKDANVPIEDLIKTMSKKSGQELLSETLSNLTTTIINLKNTIGNAWSKVFDDRASSNRIYTIIEAIENLTRKVRDLTTDSKLLEDIFVGIFSIFKTFNNIVSQIVRGGLSVLQKILGSLKINVKDFSLGIGDALKKFSDWIVDNDVIYKALDGIGGKIAEVIEILKGWIDTIAKSEKFIYFVNGLKDGLSNLRKELDEFDFSNLSFDTVKKNFEIFIQKVKESPKKAFESIGSALANFIKNTKDSFLKIGEYIGITYSSIEENGLKIVDSIKRTIETLVGIFAGYMVLKGLGKVVDGLTALLQPFATVSNLIKAFTGVGNSLKKYIDSLTNNRTVNNILKFSIAIGIMVGSIWLIAKLGKDDVDNILKVAAAIGILMVSVGVLSILLAKSKTMKKGSKDLATTLIMIAGSLGIIAASFYILSKVNFSDLLPAIIGLVAVIGGLWAATKIINKNKKEMAMSFKTLLSIAGSLLAVSIAFKILSTIPIEQIASGVIGLVGIVISFSILLRAMSKISSDSKVGKQLISAALSIGIFVLALKFVANMDPEEYIKGLLGISGIVLAFAALGLTVRLAGKNITAQTTFFISLAAATLLIAMAIKQLDKINIGKIIILAIEALAMMYTIGKVAVASMKGMRIKGTEFKAFAGMALIIFTLASSLYIMAGAVLIFKNMDLPGLAKGVIAVIALLTGLGAALWLMNKSHAVSNTNIYAAKMLVSMAIVLGTLAVAVFVLSSIDTVKLIATVGSIVILMGAIALLMSTFVTFSGLKVGALLIGIVGMALILSEFVAVLLILSKIQIDDTFITKVESMIALVLAFSAAIAVIGLIGTIVGPVASVAIPAIALLEALMVSLLAVIALWVNAFAEFDISTIEKAKQVAFGIGEMIGGFVGSIVDSYITKATQSLENVGKILYKFAGNIIPFITIMSNGISSKVTGNTQAIIDLIEQLSNKNFANSIKKLSENKTYFAQLKDVLRHYSDALVYMSAIIGGDSLDRSAFETAKIAAETIAVLYNALPKQGGKSEWWSGKQMSLGSFATQMQLLAGGLVAFAEKVKGLKSEEFRVAEDAAKALASLLNSLPSQGGILQKITGSKSFKDFGTQMDWLARGLVAFTHIVTYGYGNSQGGYGGMANENSKKAFDIAVQAAQALSDLKNALPADGGWLQKVLGSQSLGKFGSDASELAKGLVEFTGIVTNGFLSSTGRYYFGLGDISEGSAFDTAIKAAYCLSELNDALPETGGIKSLFSGHTMSMEEFGENMTGLGVGLSNFATNVSGITSSASTFNTAMYILGRLKDFYKELPQVEGGLNDKHQMTLAEFGKDLEALGQSLSAFNSSLTEFDGEKATKFKDSILQLFNIEGSYESLTNTGKNLSTILVQALNTGLTDPTNVDMINNASKSLGDNSAKKMNASTQAKESGINTLKGLYSGLTDATWLAKIASAGHEAGRTYQDAFDSELDEHSPSREMKKRGINAIKGLVIGLTDQLNTVKDAGTLTGSILLDSVTKSLELAEETLSDGLNPVITPVLDLSEIQNGASGLSSLLNNSSLYATASGLGGQILNSRDDLNAIGNQVTVNTTFNIDNNGKDITEDTLNDWSNKIANNVNLKLGALYRR